MTTTIWGYRLRRSAPRGVAGTFYWTELSIQRWQYLRDGIYAPRDFRRVRLQFLRPLTVPDEMVEPGFVTSGLAARWFPHRRFTADAIRIFGTFDEGEDTLLSDIAVAMEATRRGHDGILYGTQEIVDLRPLIERGLFGKAGEDTLIHAILTSRA